MVSKESSSLKPFAILTGPTGSGKSQIALEFAASKGSIEIVNADSIAWVRGFDIGSAKPSPEEQALVPHHLIDVFEPEARYTARDFVEAADRAIQDIFNRGHRPLLVGGSGFYLKAWLYGMWDAPDTQPELREELSKLSSEELYERLKSVDPDHAAKLHSNDTYRIIRALEIWTVSGQKPSVLEQQKKNTQTYRYPVELLVIDRDRDILNARLRARAQAMLEKGWIEEVRTLRSKNPHAPALASVGYAQICNWLDGISPEGRKLRPGQEGLLDEIELATRQLVKSQRTWFRGQTQAHFYTLEPERETLWNHLNSIYDCATLDPR